MNLEDIYDLSLLMTLFSIITNIISELKSNLLFKLGSIFTPFTKDNKLVLFNSANEIIKGLNDLLGHLKQLNITSETQEDIDYYIEKMKNYNPENSLNYNQAEDDFIQILKEIEESSKLWQDRILIELRKIPIIMPFLDGTLDSQKLLTGPESFFSLKPKIWDKLKDIEKNDFNEFINSYLNKAWTASGIMAMRIIESAVRTYYTKLTHQPIVDQNGYFKSLGKILSELEKEKDADQFLIKELKHVNSTIRNPIAHPEDILKHEDAETIFQYALKIVNIINK